MNSKILYTKARKEADEADVIREREARALGLVKNLWLFKLDDPIFAKRDASRKEWLKKQELATTAYQIYYQECKDKGIIPDEF